MYRLRIDLSVILSNITIFCSRKFVQQLVAQTLSHIRRKFAVVICASISCTNISSENIAANIVAFSDNFIVPFIVPFIMPLSFVQTIFCGSFCDSKDTIFLLFIQKSGVSSTYTRQNVAFIKFLYFKILFYFPISIFIRAYSF